MTHPTQAGAPGIGTARIFIGLGNPDPALHSTYHNAGMLALPAIAAALVPDLAEPLAFKRYKGIFEYAKAGDFTFVKPLTFMNESGKAAKEALRAFGAGPESLAVIHDDSDLPVGAFRIAQGGSSAGHNGIRSIAAHLGTESFARVRIGIREPEEAHRKKAGDFVLSPISPRHMKMLEKSFEEIGAALRDAII